MIYKSENSDVAVTVTFYNKCPEEVQLFWHDQEGNLVPQSTLPVGAQGGTPQPTFVTHPWSAKSMSGVPVMIFDRDVFIPYAGQDGKTIFITPPQPQQPQQPVAPAQPMMAPQPMMMQQPMAGGYQTGISMQSYTTTTTTTTTTVIQQFGIQAQYAPVAVNPAALQMYNQYAYKDPGVYQGAFDGNGMRSGVGTCTWSDGSTYEGDWLNNMRHGNGKFNNDTYEYMGEWQQDMKHGRGKYTNKKGAQLPIFAPMENDKLNGLGVQGDKTILFKEGMEVNLSGNEFECKKFFWGLFGIIYFGAFYAALVYAQGMMREDERPPMYFLMLILYVIYQITACQSDAFKYLRNTLSTTVLFDNITKAIAAPPECIYKIQCYHWETRTDSKGNTRRVRVDTHSAEDPFRFTGWVDRSPPATSIDYLNNLLVCRLNIDEIIDMAPMVRKRYQDTKRDFIDHNNRDTHYDFVFETDVPFTVERTLVYQEKLGAKPWYANFYIHCLLDVLFIGWLQRFFLEKESYEVKYKILKYLWE